MVKRRLNLVAPGTLTPMVRTALQNALGRPAPGDFADRLALELMRTIRNSGSAVQGMSRADVLSELKRSNHELVQARDRVRAELEALLEATHRGELQRVQLAETHDQMQRIVDRGAAPRDEIARSQLDELFARARAGRLSIDALHEHVRAVVLEAAQLERREFLDGLNNESARQIDQLERRITKLNRSLEASEFALRELAARKDVDPGLESIYRTVQGLAGDAPDAKVKTALLERIFLANVEIRGQLGERVRFERASSEAGP